MLAQKVIIDGDPFILTLPLMREHEYLLHLLRAKHRKEFVNITFHSLVFYQQDPHILMYCNNQQRMEYKKAGTIYNGTCLPIDSFSKVGLTVFPKLIPLDRMDQPYKLDAKDYPEGTITTGGTISFNKNKQKEGTPYSSVTMDSANGPAVWGDPFTGHLLQVSKLPMVWVVIDGLLFAVSAGWRCSIEKLGNLLPWDYTGKVLANQYHRYPQAL